MCWFASASLVELGFFLPEAGQVEFFGDGASSTVYRGTLNDEMMVVKVYRDEHNERKQKEKKTLHLLSEKNVPHIPWLVSVEISDSVLVTKPCATHFSDTQLKYIRQLVRVAISVHHVMVVRP